MGRQPLRQIRYFEPFLSCSSRVSPRAQQLVLEAFSLGWRQHCQQQLLRRRRTAAGFILTWSNTAAHSGLLGVRRDTGLYHCTSLPDLYSASSQLGLVALSKAENSFSNEVYNYGHESRGGRTVVQFFGRGRRGAQETHHTATSVAPPYTEAF